MALWRQPAFAKLWVGQTISNVGTQVTQLALGLTAAVVLDASPVEMGILGTLYTVPFLLFSLLAGVWVDRLARKPILIAADLGRAALLASIPLAALTHTLGLPLLYVVAFGVGSLNVFFAVAYGSFLPSLVVRRDLAEGNARLALSEAVSRAIGPGLAGALVQVLTAPVAIAADAASFLISAVSLVWIDVDEAPPDASQRRGLWSEVSEGVRAVFDHPLLRPLFAAFLLGNIGDGLLIESGIILLFLTRDIGLEPAAIGAIFSGLGIGGLLGAALAGVITRALGPGVTMLGGLVIWGLAFSAMALSPTSAAVVPFVAALLGAVGTINPVAGANLATLRQAVTPDRLLGRVMSVSRLATWGGVTIGALLGGIVAERIGLRATVLLSGLLPLIGAVWLLLSPVRRVRRLDSLEPPCSEKFS
jgi:predicted MFS family arabinose efflux permease